MPSFENLFIKSKGQPVEYNGKIIQMVDKIPINGKRKVLIIFEEVHSNWRQGIYLSINGMFEVNGGIFKKNIVLWEDTAPKKVVLKINSKQEEILLIKNVWDTGDGVINSWHNGAAIIVEEHKFSRLYHCNDGHPDDDFNDLVFSLTF